VISDELLQKNMMIPEFGMIDKKG